jgi:hypothetical protein
MAAYASAVTKYTKDVQRISRDLGILCGKIDITNYNSTTTEETNITRYFKPSAVSGIEKGIISLTVVSSENGYVLGFNKSTGKFKAYRSPAATTTGNVVIVGGGVGEAIGINPDTNAGVLSKAAATNRTIPIATFLGATAPAIAAAAFAEVADDTDLGTFDFIAIGFIAGGAR